MDDERCRRRYVYKSHLGWVGLGWATATGFLPLNGWTKIAQSHEKFQFSMNINSVDFWQSCPFGGLRRRLPHAPIDFCGNIIVLGHNQVAEILEIRMSTTKTRNDLSTKRRIPIPSTCCGFDY